MKQAITTLAIMIWVAGLIMAGADGETINGQVAWNIAGLIMFVGSSCFLAWDLRRE